MKKEITVKINKAQLKRLMRYELVEYNEQPFVDMIYDYLLSVNSSDINILQFIEHMKFFDLTDEWDLAEFVAYYQLDFEEETEEGNPDYETVDFDSLNNKDDEILLMNKEKTVAIIID